MPSDGRAAQPAGDGAPASATSEQPLVEPPSAKLIVRLFLIPLPTGDWGGIVLEGAQLNEVAIPGKVGAIPDEPINSVAEQWHR